MSDADVFSEWNSNRWSRNSIHSLIGIFLESKIVPVKAVNFLPHSQHSKLLTPDPLNPSLANVPPQCGQHFGLIELMSASSSADGFRCFCSYHSKTVASIMASVPVLPFSRTTKTVAAT